MKRIFKKLAKIQKKQPVASPTYEEIKRDAIESTKARINERIDKLKIEHDYRDLTRHEQYLLGLHISDWYEDEKIAVIQDNGPNAASYVIVINLWQPSLETYYVENNLLKEDNYKLSEKDKRLCVLLADEAIIAAQIMSSWKILQDSIEYYDEKIKEEGENK